VHITRQRFGSFDFRDLLVNIGKLTFTVGEFVSRQVGMSASGPRTTRTEPSLCFTCILDAYVFMTPVLAVSLANRCGLSSAINYRCFECWTTSSSGSLVVWLVARCLRPRA